MAVTPANSYDTAANGKVFIPNGKVTLANSYDTAANGKVSNANGKVTPTNSYDTAASGKVTPANGIHRRVIEPLIFYLRIIQWRKGGKH